VILALDRSAAELLRETVDVVLRRALVPGVEESVVGRRQARSAAIGVIRAARIAG
jgi:hypothetical protein